MEKCNRCFVVYLHPYQDRSDNPNDEILQVFRKWKDAANFIVGEVKEDAKKMDPNMNVQQVLQELGDFRYTDSDFGYKMGIVEKMIK